MCVCACVRVSVGKTRNRELWKILHINPRSYQRSCFCVLFAYRMVEVVDFLSNQNAYTGVPLLKIGCPVSSEQKMCPLFVARRISTSSRSLCCLRVSPCSIRSSCRQTNELNVWDCREYMDLLLALKYCRFLSNACVMKVLSIRNRAFEC